MCKRIFSEPRGDGGEGRTASPSCTAQGRGASRVLFPGIQLRSTLFRANNPHFGQMPSDPRQVELAQTWGNSALGGWTGAGAACYP